MREVSGDGWAEISKYAESVMGVELDRSTMRKRYAKMKANFVAFEVEDVCFLGLHVYAMEWLTLFRYLDFGKLKSRSKINSS